MVVSRSTVVLTVTLGFIFIIIMFFSVNFALNLTVGQLDILKSLIGVNVVLIGFVVVIAVFVLGEYRVSIYRIEDQMDTEELTYERRAKENAQIGQSNLAKEYPNISDYGDGAYTAHKNRMQELQRNLKKLRDNRKATVLIVVASVLSFVGLIMSGLVAMNLLNVSARFFPIYTCMALLLAGIVFLLMAIINYAYLD